MSEKNTQLVTVQQTNEQLAFEVNRLKHSNDNLTREVAKIDRDLAKARDEIAYQQLLVSYLQLLIINVMLYIHILEELLI